MQSNKVRHALFNEITKEMPPQLQKEDSFVINLIDCSSNGSEIKRLSEDQVYPAQEKNTLRGHQTQGNLIDTEKVNCNFTPSAVHAVQNAANQSLTTKNKAESGTEHDSKVRENQCENLDSKSISDQKFPHSSLEKTLPKKQVDLENLR